MAKRVFIIHGWGGHPREGWFPWLKHELETRRFQVMVPAMLEPAVPRIEPWVRHLTELIANPTVDTHLVGHSVGCQTILRYLETLSGDTKVGGVILVAGWTTLTPAATPTTEEQAIARPWLEIPLDWDTIRQRATYFTAIFSDNDEYVPMENTETFKSKLDAEIVVEHGKGHFSGGDGVTELPAALEAIVKHAGAI